MGVSYQAVGWNRQKKVYDRTLVLGVVLYLVLFVGIGFATHPEATAETMILRAFGTGAFVLLHVVLSIGPLARLDRRFLPLLYNRRHLGVVTFLLGGRHGGFALVQFHALGDTNPLVSVLVSNTRVDSFAQFPFQPLGLLALVILFLMAATSHDFWLANLTAPVWKALHMLVYVAYASARRAARGARRPAGRDEPGLLAGPGRCTPWCWVFGAARVRRLARGPRRTASPRGSARPTAVVDVCAVDDIPEIARPHRDARRRARGRVPVRRQGLRPLQRLPAPERPAGRGEASIDGLRHVPLARLPVRARIAGALARAVHREACPTFQAKVAWTGRASWSIPHPLPGRHRTSSRLCHRSRRSAGE